MKNLIVIVLLICVHSFAASTIEAAYGAGVGSNNRSTPGRISLSWNYQSSSAAINAAMYRNSGYSPYTWRWWSYRRYCAIARAFTGDGYYWNFGYAYGWATRTSAINKARSYTYYYSEAWVSAYNNWVLGNGVGPQTDGIRVIFVHLTIKSARLRYLIS